MLKPLILTIVVIGTSLPAVSSSKIVFRGKPLFHVVVSPDTVTHEAVPADKRDQFMTLITKDDKSDTYTWASREDRQLIGVPSGTFLYFVAPATGIVKVGNIEEMRRLFTSALLPQLQLAGLSEADAAQLFWQKQFLNNTPEMKQADYAYVEILWQSFGVIIYYGVADQLDP